MKYIKYSYILIGTKVKAFEKEKKINILFKKMKCLVVLPAGSRRIQGISDLEAFVEWTLGFF